MAAPTIDEDLQTSAAKFLGANNPRMAQIAPLMDDAPYVNRGDFEHIHAKGS